ncbi:MAG: tandem-95 repeat protein [Ramlibacter sp.]|nr:tandem-95 repeat protein [Ramlibacter sp.]
MTVSFTATDVFGATAHTDFLLTVGGDHAPVINGAMGRSHATPDEPWTFTVPDNVFVDPDVGDTLTYAVDTLPSWISFDPATRTFHGTASEADAGVTTIVVTATDQLGRSSSGAYLELHISHGVWVTGSGILQGSSSSDDWLTATGSNTQLFGGAGDDVLAAGHPQEFGVLDNLVFVGGPGDDYLYRSYGSNYYQFNIGDGHDQIDWEFFPATGAEGGEDWLQFGLGITPQDITVTGDYELTFTVGNGDDSVNVADWFYDADGGEDEGGTFFKIEHVTFADGTQWGIADVEAIAAAGGHVNPDNLAPLLTTPLDDQSADAGTQWSFAIPAGRFSDPDGDTLSYHATLGNGDPLPAWLTFNPATRGFEGTPPSGTPNLSLKLTAIDTSGARVSGVFTLDIVAGNTAPVVANPLTAKATGEDAAWTFTVPAGTFTDADAADTLTYSATLANGNALPAWLGFNAATRTFTGTPQNGDVGGLSLKVTATDSAGAAASSTFALTIANVNDAPTVAQTIVNQAATEEQPWSYAVSADTFTDMDAGDTLSYTAMLADGTALPPWLSFSAATGTFNGTPRNGDVGTLSLKVRAVDLAGATASTGFDLTVANVNDAPTVSQSIANQSINEDQSFSFTVPAATFADVDAGDTLTYSASLAGGAALPSWLAFDASTLSFGGTPAAADLGNLNLELTATDSAGATANTSFGLNVAHVNHAPVVAQVLSGQEAVATQAWTYTVPAGAFTDPDTGDTLTYGATLTNGNALPAWLAFSAATRTFSGTPGSTDAGLVALQVVATDAAGATASQSFNLGVSSIPGLTVVGTSAANTLTGGAGDDRIDGLGGADTMRGLGGNDTYVVDNAKDVVVEAADQGYDRIESSVTYTVPANVEAITLTGAAGIGATGNALNNELVGNSGGNKLDGGVGADRMLGGLGNDTYVVDNPGDLVVELAAEGTDTVHSSVSYTLPGNAENLTLIGAESLAATGNDQNNTITANAAGSVLSGLDGNDTLRGAGGADTLYGGAGNDRLDGGAAADQMFGGAGNDTYVADNAGDVAIEQAGDGTDTVQSSVSHTLGANIENLTLTGTASMVATGNDLNNIITANAAASVLSGLGGNDTLRGGAAADILYGGDGNDRLDGREAADQLFGGAGNDTYVVDDAGDTVTEQAGEGTDIVQSSVSYTLGANIENLTLTGTASLAGTGNDLSNTLTANATGGTLWGMAGNDTLRGAAGADILYGGEGNDRMDGLAGADQLIGGAGNDTYVVGDAGDAVTELAGEGTDIVQSSVSYTLSSNVENLTLTGSAAIDGTGNEQANIITGNGAANALHGLGGNDTINGGAANDTLEGGRGDDRLNGGSGADTYLFGRGDGVDTLTDVEATAGVQDMLQFGSGIAADQLWLRKVANNLEVSVIGTTDKVTITGWYTDAAHHVETLQLAGGQRLMDSQVQNLVQAMASFAPPAVGQTTLPQSYSSLEGVIAANWQ